MKTNHDHDIVSQSDSQLNEMLISNRSMTETSLRMRAMAYISQIKANLLTETIYELNKDKKIFANYAKNLKEKNDLLEEQKKIIEKQNKKLQEQINLKEENILIKYQAEELERLNENLNTASKVAKIGFWDLDIKTDELNWNEGTYDIFEVKDRTSNLTSEKFFSFLPNEWKEKVGNEFYTSLEQRKDYFIIHQIITEKGNLKYVEERAKHYFDNNDKYIKSIGSVLDITELMITQNKLKKEQQKFHDMFKKHGSIMILVEPESGQILDANEKALDFYGYYNDEFLSMKVTEINTLSAEEIKRKILKAKEKKQNHFEFSHRLKNGTIKNVEVSSTPIETIDGVVLFSIIKDITKEKEYEEKLKTQKEEFESIFNYSKDGIAIIDLECNFLECNEEYTSMIGYSKEELLTKKYLEITLGEEEECEKISRILLKKSFIKNYEKICITKDGNKITTNMSFTLLPDKNRILITTRDMSHLKIIEEQSKLASMGEMIGNIAHQWRQPLNAISTATSGMLIKHKMHELEQKDLEFFAQSVIKNANFLSNTIDTFRDYVKEDKQYKTIIIQEEISKALKISKNFLNSGFIKLEEYIDYETPIKIDMVSGELLQVIINILNNAKDIFEERKTLCPVIKLYLFHILDEKVIISIEDNGGGIEDEVLPHIFEPYFTTKHQSQGTGLGLYMSYKIITESLKGKIYVKNVKNGAKFFIEIPI